MSFFKYKRVAEGYGSVRPYYHPIVIRKIKDKYNLSSKVGSVLDVGCGAGLSSKALVGIAEKITGIDSSTEMIETAKKVNKNIDFYTMPAEKIGFEDASFDLLTICGAINWIDRKHFLPEASRVLTNKGIMVIYDNVICDYMDDNKDYSDWFKNQYLKKFPKPYRNEDSFTQGEVEDYNFRYLGEELYKNKIKMTVSEFTDFILTQSNVINAVDMGEGNILEAREWFINSLTEIFTDNEMVCNFEGFIWYFKKNGSLNI